ncbi:hypothetical protein, partial [Staphylococcus aureus]
PFRFIFLIMSCFLKYKTFLYALPPVMVSSATMLAPSNQILKKCIRDWLIEAGTKEGITRTLIVKDEAAYNALVDYLPDDWKKDAAGTTV